MFSKMQDQNTLLYFNHCLIIEKTTSQIMYYEKSKMPSVL